MENQEHLMNTIGPMYVEQQAAIAAAATIPAADGTVTLST